jgi:hypothetical protein
MTFVPDGTKPTRKTSILLPTFFPQGKFIKSLKICFKVEKQTEAGIKKRIWTKPGLHQEQKP